MGPLTSNAWYHATALAPLVSSRTPEQMQGVDFGRLAQYVPRICQIITRLVVGGAQRIAVETALFLTRSGWETELWTGSQTGPEGSLADEARARGATLRIVPHLVRELSPCHDLQALLWLQRHLAAGHFDLVHTHSSKAGILGRIAATQAGVPVRVHSAHAWGMTPDTSPATRALYTWLERHAAQRTHAILAVSEAVRDSGLACGIGTPVLYTVIRGGIPIPPPRGARDRAAARALLGIPEAATVLGTVGRLDDAKDPLGALAGLAPLLASLPDTHAVFIGDGKLRAAVEEGIRSAGLAGRVTLAGLRRDAAALMAAFDIFFLCSRWEGFPLVIVEAMACGLPCVAYDVAGVREALQDGVHGFLALPGDVHGWRDGLRRLIASPALRLKMGQAARATAERDFALQRMLADTLQLYERLLSP